MIAEAYALNIMPQTICDFIGCYRSDKERIEEVRGDFLNFLQEREKDGIIYPSQVDAWNVYKEWQVMFSSTEEFEHLDIDEIEVVDMSWAEELVKLFYEKANSIDLLANYSYEHRKGLPSQQ